MLFLKFMGRRKRVILERNSGKLIGGTGNSTWFARLKIIHLFACYCFKVGGSLLVLNLLFVIFNLLPVYGNLCNLPVDACGMIGMEERVFIIVGFVNSIEYGCI